jgi:hypothetical protein
MIENKCKQHIWKKLTDATRQAEVGAIPAYYRCENCRTLMTAPEIFQLEALENQNETLKHLKGFQKNIAIVAVIISVVALIISIFK